MKFVMAITSVVIGMNVWADGAEDKMKHARRYGAEAHIVLRCVDQDKHSVSNAHVSAGLYPDGSFENALCFNSYTDTNGVFEMKGKTNGEVTYEVKKNGYYNTLEQKFLFKLPDVSVSHSRWQPYGMTNTVVLKRMINPVAMCVKRERDRIKPPVKDEHIGFDFEKGDWVSPHGKGIVADINMKYGYEAGKIPVLHYRGSVSFSFPNPLDGAYAMKKEPFSALVSVYRADTNAVYQREWTFTYDRLSGVRKEDTRFPESDYLVLRTRSKTDEDGNLVSAHYAKIYGPISAGGGGIYLSFHFNPNENDSNLEADTTKNLRNPRDLGFAP